MTPSNSSHAMSSLKMNRSYSSENHLGHLDSSQTLNRGEVFLKRPTTENPAGLAIFHLLLVLYCKPGPYASFFVGGGGGGGVPIS